MYKSLQKYLILCLILFITACTSTSRGTPIAEIVGLTSTPKEATDLPPTRINLTLAEEPASLGFQHTSDISMAEVIRYTCETLVYRGTDGNFKPGLAENWKVAEDEMSMTLTIRQGVIFHDGTSLNADAVKFTFERLQKDESIASPVYEDFSDVKIEKLDSQTIRLSFSEPRGDFLNVLENRYASILSPTALQADEQSFGRHPICTGPYEVAEWKTSQYVSLKRFDQYAWPPEYYSNRGPAYIDEIRIHFIPDGDVRYLALLNGELDILSLGESEEVLEIEGKSQEFSTYPSWANGITYLGFNYQRSPTNEILVRQAIAHAIDREAIVDALLPGLAEVAISPLAPGVFGYSSQLADFGYKFDPEQSRQLLKDAGFEDTDEDGFVERNGQPLQLKLLTLAGSDTYNNSFILLQNYLEDIGIQLNTLQSVPQSQLLEITSQNPENTDYDLLLFHYAWGAPTALSLFLTCDRIGASNRIFYCDPDFEELLEQAFSLPENSSEQEAVLLQAQKKILEDAPWQPLFVRKIVIAVNSRINGIKYDEGLGLLLHDAYIGDIIPSK